MAGSWLPCNTVKPVLNGVPEGWEVGGGGGNGRKNCLDGSGRVCEKKKTAS